MPLPIPNLHDRSFHQLVEEARRRAEQTCPAWSDLSDSDPGIVLLELFAHLTELMLYRLNRVPEKLYVEFLRLIGVDLRPPAAATVRLKFGLSRGSDVPVEIPRGTRVTIPRSGPDSGVPVFVTSRSLRIEAGQLSGSVVAHDCENVDAELLGVASGRTGLSLRVSRPPIVAPTGDDLDLVVGVEATDKELEERVHAIKHKDKTYRIWTEVENFSSVGPDRFVYVVDRTHGTITFAPSVKMKREGPIEALAEVPRAGREIRAWYRRGGGAGGNVAAGSLTVLKEPIRGVEVTNPGPATGGSDAETLENALVRGPQEFHSLRRAVTARDFELIAGAGGVARARAFTKARLWRHAPPGTVEVLLVPAIPVEQKGAGPVTEEILQRFQTEEIRERINRELDERRPLGTSCLVSWVRYKPVRVHARVVTYSGEDVAAIKRRVQERLDSLVSPLPTLERPSGWEFGVPLRASNIYDIGLAEPGVKFVDRVRIVVDDVPNVDIRSLAADFFQPSTWYASSGPNLYRSLNDGDSWEAVRKFDGETKETIQKVRAHPERAGFVAVVTSAGDSGSGIHISMDCGESWSTRARTSFAVHDITWMLRDYEPLLLLASDVGLFELSLREGSVPVPVIVDPANENLGFYAVAAWTDVSGGVQVAVAAREKKGVFHSNQGGRTRTFSAIELTGTDVRVLEVQHDGPHTILWAGASAEGDVPGEGCFRRQILGGTPSPDGWGAIKLGWQGGSCHALASQGATVFAASHSSGVLWVDTSRKEPRWTAPEIGSGLPLRDRERFHPVRALAADQAQRRVLAGGPEGVLRSHDQGKSYASCSEGAFADSIPLPNTWLFCSAGHELSVVAEDETSTNP